MERRRKQVRKERFGERRPKGIVVRDTERRRERPTRRGTGGRNIRGGYGRRETQGG